MLITDLWNILLCMAGKDILFKTLQRVSLPVLFVISKNSLSNTISMDTFVLNFVNPKQLPGD
jgi:hypothetical protein